MAQTNKERLVQDIGKLFFGKDEPTFSLEKFMRAVQEAPTVDARLIEGSADD